MPCCSLLSRVLICCAAKFFWYLLFSYLTLLYFTFYGMMAVAVSPHVQLAAVISSAFYSIWFLFAGFLIPRPVRGSSPNLGHAPFHPCMHY